LLTIASIGAEMMRWLAALQYGQRAGAPDAIILPIAENIPHDEHS
jgi:hypothetical protein